MSTIQVKTGTVRKIEEGRILVELAPVLQPGCESSCHCKGIVLENTPRGPQVWVQGKANQIGEKVFVQIQLPTVYMAIFFVFVLPVILLVLGALVGEYLARTYSLSKPNLWMLLFAGGGFLCAMGLAGLFDKLYRVICSDYTLWDGKGNLQELLRASLPCAGCTSHECTFAHKK